MIRPTPRSRGEKRAFSLVELLVVITIIGILVGILVPVGNQVNKQMRKTAAAKDCTELRSGIANYYTEYKRYPGLVTSETPISTAAGTGLISTLIADTNDSQAERFNPRGILFFSGKVAKHQDTHGLYTENSPRFNDPWSTPGDPHPYWVIFDYDYNNKVNVPDPDGGERELYTNVAVWSLGPDGQESTDDDVTSY